MKKIWMSLEKKGTIRVFGNEIVFLSKVTSTITIIYFIREWITLSFHQLFDDIVKNISSMSYESWILLILERTIFFLFDNFLYNKQKYKLKIAFFITQIFINALSMPVIWNDQCQRPFRFHFCHFSLTTGRFYLFIYTGYQN